MTTNAPPVLGSDPTDYVAPFVSVDAATLASHFKKGYKTTEFWTALATAGTVILNAVFDLGLDSESVIALVGTNASYILGRSFLKKERVKALSYTE